MKLVAGVTASAQISHDGIYRYLLTREWDPRRRHVLWIMLNPSVADGDVDDPTSRACQSFARQWGYGGISIVNLFALRAPKPEALFRHPDPIGPENDEMIVAAATDARSGLVVDAWGAHGALMNRGLIVRRMLGRLGVDVYSLGPALVGGHPHHPLYLPPDTPLRAYPPIP